MTKTRDSLIQRFEWAVAALVLALIAVGCAASEGPRADAPNSQQREVGLTGAHLDKRKFLLAASMLGVSPERDIELLSVMTGVKVEPKPEDKPSFRGVERTFQALIPLRGNDRIPGSTSYVYGVNTKGDYYTPSIALYIQKEFACIRVEDLTSALGPPEKVLTYPPSPHAKKTGPIDVWTVRYVFASGRNATFNFDTQVCAGSFSLYSEFIYKR